MCAIAWPVPACGARSRAYGIEAELIEDHVPMKLHERAGAAVAAVRRGEGPRFIECMTYRWRDHVGPTEDRVHKYRPDTELDAKIEGDNLKIVGELLPAELTQVDRGGRGEAGRRRHRLRRSQHLPRGQGNLRPCLRPLTATAP